MVKIDIISGFLGAGKTTFANMLLEHYINSGLRPVYIVNEFGQTGLDAKIVRLKGFKAVEMSNGCVCCTLKGDVALTIKEVIRTFSPTNIVFEPSGVFVFENFIEIIRSDMLKDECETGIVFTIVDSVNFNASKAVYGSFIYNQIKNAPVIILSKLEKTKNDVEEIICDIKNINPNAYIAAQRWDEWDANEMNALMNKNLRPDSVIAAPHQHQKLKTLTVPSKKCFSTSEADAFIEKYKNGDFGDVYRIKGVMNINGNQILINISLEDVELTPFSRPADTAVTFIGNFVNKSAVENWFI